MRPKNPIFNRAKLNSANLNQSRFEITAVQKTKLEIPKLPTRNGIYRNVPNTWKKPVPPKLAPTNYGRPQVFKSQTTMEGGMLVKDTTKNMVMSSKPFNPLYSKKMITKANVISAMKLPNKPKTTTKDIVRTLVNPTIKPNVISAMKPTMNINRIATIASSRITFHRSVSKSAYWMI